MRGAFEGWKVLVRDGSDGGGEGFLFLSRPLARLGFAAAADEVGVSGVGSLLDTSRVRGGGGDAEVGDGVEGGEGGVGELVGEKGVSAGDADDRLEEGLERVARVAVGRDAGAAHGSRERGGGGASRAGGGGGEGGGRGAGGGETRVKDRAPRYVLGVHVNPGARREGRAEGAQEGAQSGRRRGPPRRAGRAGSAAVLAAAAARTHRDGRTLEKIERGRVARARGICAREAQGFPNHTTARMAAKSEHVNRTGAASLRRVLDVSEAEKPTPGARSMYHHHQSYILL